MTQKIKVTLDTNVLISGTFWRSDSFNILNYIHNGFIEGHTTKDITDEYLKVIFSSEIFPKNKLKLESLFVINIIIFDSIMNFPEQKVDIVKEDPDDNKIIECALSSKSDYIITQDKHLLKIKSFKGIVILTPDEFLKIFRNFNAKF